MNKQKYICPICGYDGLDKTAYNETREPSFEICPKCGNEFGFDDFNFRKSVKNLQNEYKIRYKFVQDEINKLDPIGLAPGEVCPINEYSQEVEMIMPEIKFAKSYIDLAQKIKEIFNKMFNEDFSEDEFYTCAKNILEKIKSI